MFDYSDVAGQLRRLGETGNSIPDEARSLCELSGAHAGRGAERSPVSVDAVTLARSNTVYAEQALLRPLEGADIKARRLADALGVLSEAFNDTNRLVWGVSGYAEADHNYTSEVAALKSLYTTLQAFDDSPSLVIDGGGSVGVLGASALCAAQRNIPTLGYTPLKGLASVGMRTHTVVRMDTFRQREILVGTTPDVLVCVGGGEGTLRELERTALGGSAALILVPQRYPGKDALWKTYKQSAKLRSACSAGRIVYCDDMRELRGAVSAVRQAARQHSVTRRRHRLRALQAHLGA